MPSFVFRRSSFITFSSCWMDQLSAALGSALEEALTGDAAAPLTRDDMARKTREEIEAAVHKALISSQVLDAIRNPELVHSLLLEMAAAGKREQLISALQRGASPDSRYAVRPFHWHLVRAAPPSALTTIFSTVACHAHWPCALAAIPRARRRSSSPRRRALPRAYARCSSPRPIYRSRTATATRRCTMRRPSTMRPLCCCCWITAPICTLRTPTARMRSRCLSATT